MQQGVGYTHGGVFLKHQQNGYLGLPKTDGLCELVGGFFFVKHVLWFNYLERAS